jgi:lipopolysaccharide export system protein LptA
MFGLIALVSMAFQVAAEEQPAGSPQTENENRIYVTADALITNTNEKNAEFIGNVRATQGTTVITSDRLKVFYREQSDNQQQPIAEADVISRIIAEGNVKIVFDNQVATTEHAEYLADQGIVILSGNDTKIVSGSNSISGTKITLFRNDGRIQVESSQEKRVEAFFYSQDGGMASPKKNSQ